jgi:hypothetical protein
MKYYTRKTMKTVMRCMPMWNAISALRTNGVQRDKPRWWHPATAESEAMFFIPNPEL